MRKRRVRRWLGAGSQLNVVKGRACLSNIVKRASRAPIVPRLLTKTEAARYLNINMTSFSKLCPLRPISLGQGTSLLRYDVVALDKWIDSLGDPIERDAIELLNMIGSGQHKKRRTF